MFSSRVTNVKRNQVTSMESLEEKAIRPDVAGCTELWSNGRLGKPIPERDTNAYKSLLIERTVLTGNYFVNDYYTYFVAGNK